MLKLAENPDTFMEKLQALARNAGGEQILKDQKSRIKIIYEYYLELIKDQELQKRQEESERKFKKLKKDVKSKSLKEVFDSIKAYMDLEYSGLYAEKVEYKVRFGEIFEETKGRKMDDLELTQVEEFISQYFIEEKEDENRRIVLNALRDIGNTLKDLHRCFRNT